MQKLMNFKAKAKLWSMLRKVGGDAFEKALLGSGFALVKDVDGIRTYEKGEATFIVEEQESARSCKCKMKP